MSILIDQRILCSDPQILGQPKSNRKLAHTLIKEPPLNVDPIVNGHQLTLAVIPNLFKPPSSIDGWAKSSHLRLPVGNAVDTLLND